MSYLKCKHIHFNDSKSNNYLSHELWKKKKEEVIVSYSNPSWKHDSLSCKCYRHTHKILIFLYNSVTKPFHSLNTVSEKCLVFFFLMILLNFKYLKKNHKVNKALQHTYGWKQLFTVAESDINNTMLQRVMPGDWHVSYTYLWKFN